MLCKRIIPCLDVKDGRVVKGINFLDLRDAGDPVELAKVYYAQGADELIFLDVSASIEGKKTMVEVARKVASEIFIPFTIGGGIRSIEDMDALFRAGADKVSLSTAAVENPELLSEATEKFGSQAIVLSLDAKKEGDRWKVFTRSASIDSGMDGVEWARQAVALGAGEILLNSIDRDGTKKGFDLELVNSIAEAVSVPVIASGGAGRKEDFLEVFQKTGATAALAASLFHYGGIRIPDLKKYLREYGVDVREI